MIELEPAVLALLKDRNWAVLATTNADGTVQQTLMWYALDDGSIVMNTAAGRRKHRNMVARPAVSVCVTDQDRFVTIQGQATVLPDDRALHRQIGLRYSTPEDMDRAFATQFDLEERLTIRISIDHVIAGLDG